MAINLEDISVGDKVALKEGVVTAVRKDGGPYPLSIRIGVEKSTSSFALSSIATHTPAPREFKVGDEVSNIAQFTNGRFFIIATFGEWAWVRDADDWTTQFRLSDLRHADPAPAPWEAPAEERKKIEYWENVYPRHSSCRHETRESADKNAGRDRIACLHVVGYEGEGL
jgi:hypothetical protein